MARDKVAAGLLASLFGMQVRVAAPVEWAKLVQAARAAGAVEVGNATKVDYDIVFDEKAGVMFINPEKEEEVLQRFRDLIMGEL